MVGYCIFFLLFFVGNVVCPAPPVLCRNRACEWSRENLRLVQATSGFLSPPGVARALKIVNAAMFDAVSAYTDHQVPTIPDGFQRRPANERILKNQEIALSYAGYRLILEIFSARTSTANVTAFMVSLGLDPNDTSENLDTPVGHGNRAARLIIAQARRDGFNSLGDEPNTKNNVPYSDYSNYYTSNDPQPNVTLTDCSKLRSINRWQPLRVPTRDGGSVVQTYLAPYAGRVLYFGFKGKATNICPGPALFGTPNEPYFVSNHSQVLQISGQLDDVKKVIAEFWADGPRTTFPPGHWQEIAIEVAYHRKLTLIQTLNVLFVQAAAVFDAGIASWDVKRFYDSVRPITAIQCLFAGQQVLAWRRPYEGIHVYDGSFWVPYQDPFFVTPPFSEYVSGHSTFSAASAEVLKRFFFGDDYWGSSFTVLKGESLFEPRIGPGQPGYVKGKTDVPNKGPFSVGYVPARDITLPLKTFSDGADDAGISRLYGGIHINSGDIDGRVLGRAVGNGVWEAYETYSGLQVTVATFSSCGTFKTLDGKDFLKSTKALGVHSCESRGFEYFDENTGTWKEPSIGDDDDIRFKRVKRKHDCDDDDDHDDDDDKPKMCALTQKFKKRDEKAAKLFYDGKQIRVKLEGDKHFFFNFLVN